jgi:hypothetical protein
MKNMQLHNLLTNLLLCCFLFLTQAIFAQDNETIDIENQEFFQELLDEVEQIEIDDENIVPLDYSYEKFNQIIKNVVIEGFEQSNIMNLTEQYMVSYIKSLYEVITISVTSLDEIDPDEEDFTYEVLTHKGKTCYYGKLSEDHGSLLLIKYPKDNIAVLYLTMPEKTLDDMLKISDKFKF